MVKKTKSNSLETGMYQLSKNLTKNPSKSTYNAVWKSLERLMKTILKVEILEGQGSKRKRKKVLMGNILSFAQLDDETNTLNIVLNTYFLEMFGAGFITNINL